jgi:hypothetical protein
MTGFVTRVTRRVQLVEQELFTIPEYLRSPPVLVVFVLLDLYIFLCSIFRSLFALLFFWRLCCLSFFYLRILLTPLLSLNSSINDGDELERLLCLWSPIRDGQKHKNIIKKK